MSSKVGRPLRGKTYNRGRSAKNLCPERKDVKLCDGKPHSIARKFEIEKKGGLYQILIFHLFLRATHFIDIEIPC